MLKIILLLAPLALLALDLQKLSENSAKMAKQYRGLLADKAIKKYSKETQDEYSDYKKEVKEIHKEKKYIIYLTSQSLEGIHQISLTREIARLNRENAQNVKIVPIIRGFDDGVFKYAKKLKNQLDTLPPMQKMQTSQATETLRLNPKLFKYFNVQKVPAIISATCTNKFSEKTCTFFYKSDGKSSITKIMEIAQVNYLDLFKEKIDDN